MHTFCGNISVEFGQEQSIHIDSAWNSLITKRSDRVTYYLSGTTDINNSEELLAHIRGALKKLTSYDISHTGDNDPDLIETYTTPHPISGSYSYIAYHGYPFEDVKKMYENNPNVLSIRTAEVSKHLGGKVIKVDIVQ